MAPVSRSEFLRGHKEDRSEAILKFLRADKDHAFALYEILGGVQADAGASFVLDTVEAMGVYESLWALVQAGKVDQREVNGVAHFIIKA